MNSTKFQKFISTLFNPLVVPTICVLVYYLIFSNPSNPHTLKYKLTLVSFVFTVSYIIPLLMMAVLKKLGSIDSYDLVGIKERKHPVLIMIVLFYFVGKVLYNSSVTYDLGGLFFGTTLGLIISYIFLFFKIKSSLHLIAIASVLGFFLRIQDFYGLNIFPVIAIVILLSGFIGASRLHLKAHTPKEVYLGFFIGLSSQLLVYFFIK